MRTGFARIVTKVMREMGNRAVSFFEAICIACQATGTALVLLPLGSLLSRVGHDRPCSNVPHKVLQIVPSSRSLSSRCHPLILSSSGVNHEYLFQKLDADEKEAVVKVIRSKTYHFSLQERKRRAEETRSHLKSVSLAQMQYFRTYSNFYLNLEPKNKGGKNFIKSDCVGSERKQQLVKVGELFYCHF